MNRSTCQHGAFIGPSAMRSRVVLLPPRTLDIYSLVENTKYPLLLKASLKIFSKVIIPVPAAPPMSIEILCVA